jgi:tetratricopeptide (TPR) repeat protein
LAVAAGCRPAVVRVPVSPENARRAILVAGEGDVAIARKDYYAALIKYLEAARLDPNSEMTYNKLGISYSRLRDYPRAITAFTRSIGLNSKYSYAYNNLGSVYFAQDSKKKAERYFRRAIGLKNDEASFHVNLGTLFFESKRGAKGLEELRKALALDPDILKKTEGLSVAKSGSQKNSSETNYLMARLFASMGDAELAVEKLKSALADGFTDLDSLRKEHDFDPIRQDEKFIAFMKYATQLLKL